MASQPVSDHGHIFISYRRDDQPGFAGRLAEGLESAFGEGSVFRDVDDIRAGEDFVHAIHAQLRSVDVVLVMIGPHWLASARDGMRRLDEPGDFVRLEIETALRLGKPVIPVLLSGAPMPAGQDLPEGIRALARHQAFSLSDAAWKADVARLAESLRPHLSGGRRQGVWKRGYSWGLAGIGLVILLALILGRPWQDAPPTPVEPSGRESARQPEAQPARRPEDMARTLSGRWTARVKYDWGDEHDEVFEFKYLGRALHGTATYLTGRLTVEQAVLDGEWLRFVTRSQESLGSEPWKEVTHRYTGQVTPEGIRFTLESGGGYSIHPPVEFTARKVP